MPLFVVLAMTAEQRINDFMAQELANMVWEFVTAGQSEVQLFIMLAGMGKWFIGDFTEQDLANTA